MKKIKEKIIDLERKYAVAEYYGHKIKAKIYKMMLAYYLKQEFKEDRKWKIHECFLGGIYETKKRRHCSC